MAKSKLSPQIKNEIRKANDAMRHKEKRLQNAGLVGIYGQEKFDYKGVRDFETNAQARRYINQNKKIRNTARFRTIKGEESTNIYTNDFVQAFNQYNKSLNKDKINYQNQILDIQKKLRGIGNSAGNFERVYEMRRAKRMGLGFATSELDTIVNPKLYLKQLAKASKSYQDQVSKSRVKNMREQINISLRSAAEMYGIEDEVESVLKRISKMSNIEFETLYRAGITPELPDIYQPDEDSQRLFIEAYADNSERALERLNGKVLKYKKETPQQKKMRQQLTRQAKKELKLR